MKPNNINQLNARDDKQKPEAQQSQEMINYNKTGTTEDR